MLLYFDQFANADPSSAAYKNAFSYYGPNVTGGLTSTNPNIDDFTADVANGTLPQVSWIMSPDSYDEHPPAPAQLGEWYTQQILDTLTSNPEVWKSTVLFIMYDENDGFFDHVPPPTAPGGTPGEYLTNQSSQTLSQSGGIAGPIGLGVRVPMIVVSPFSAGGWVCSDVFDHTSQLQFLASLFNLSVPNVSDWRASTVGNLMSTLPALAKPNFKVPKIAAVSNNQAAPAHQQRVPTCSDPRAEPEPRRGACSEEAEAAQADPRKAQADTVLSCGRSGRPVRTLEADRLYKPSGGVIPRAVGDRNLQHHPAERSDRRWP